MSRYRNKGESIPNKYSVMLFWAGLRGAVAFALAAGLDGDNAIAMKTTILVVVVLSVIVFGGTTSRVLEIMKIQTGVEDGNGSDDEEGYNEGHYGGERFRDEDDTFGRDNNEHNQTTSQGPFSEDTRHSGGLQQTNQKHWFMSFDDKFLKPFLTRNEGSGQSNHGWDHEERRHERNEDLLGLMGGSVRGAPSLRTSVRNGGESFNIRNNQRTEFKQRNNSGNLSQSLEDSSLSSVQQQDLGVTTNSNLTGLQSFSDLGALLINGNRNEDKDESNENEHVLVDLK